MEEIFRSGNAEREIGYHAILEMFKSATDDEIAGLLIEFRNLIE